MELSKIKSLSGLLTDLQDRKSLTKGQLKQLFGAKYSAVRIGVTGPPGAGKSTLVSSMTKEFRSQGLTVGMIAVDPTSPFSSGAILGDRIRSHEHFADPGVFIRSVGSRHVSGGLTGSIFLMARAFDVFEFDIVFIETVGVGQSEIDIMNVSDCVILVFGTEFGDSIQAMKAGILEIADIIAINKSDKPGADAIKRDLRSSNQIVPICKVSALNHDSVDKLVETVDIRALKKGISKKRAQQVKAEGRSLLLMKCGEKIEREIQKLKTQSDLIKLYGN